MKSKINHGNRGTKIERLCKRLGFDYPSDYYEYIEDTYMSGNFNQVIELFNDMKHDQQVTYLDEYATDGARMLIIRHL